MARAHEVARSVRCRSERGAARVGIVNSAGVIGAEAVLRGYSQASVFAELMRKIGYQELLPRTAQRLCECHAAFVAPATQGEARPQPVLPQAVLDFDLWPGISSDSRRLEAGPGRVADLGQAHFQLLGPRAQRVRGPLRAGPERLHAALRLRQLETAIFSTAARTGLPGCAGREAWHWRTSSPVWRWKAARPANASGSMI